MIPTSSKSRLARCAIDRAIIVESQLILSTAYIIALTASALWFTAAFRYFSFQHVAAAKVFIPESARNSPIFMTTAALTRFLGGMNCAFAFLSIGLIVLWATGSQLFSNPAERELILFALGGAHFSQFVFNVPILKNGGWQGESY